MKKPIDRKENGMDEKMETVLKEIYEKLTDEQKEKAKMCKSMDELMKLLGECGIEPAGELPDAEAESASGGIQAGSVFRREYHDVVRPMIDQKFYL